MDCLSLIEAGLDFSSEDIEFLSSKDAVQRISSIKNELQQLLTGGVSLETIVDLPAVAIAGAANAGKSSLVNSLLGKQRSIVSERRKTTRDVLSGQLDMEHGSCVLFDCAGLLTETDDLLDELAQAAAVEAIRKSAIVVFCVDAAKADFSEDLKAYRLVEENRGSSGLIAVAAKADLLGKKIADCCSGLREQFGLTFFPVSSKNGKGLEDLRLKIDDEILQKTTSSSKHGLDTRLSITLTSRHRQVVIEAIENLIQAMAELDSGGEEVVAMLLRAAYQQLSEIQLPQVEDIDEQILGKIFSRFCIGK
jgi:tRNA modification GTPase